MSELGKIREGSPRVYRDRVFGQRGVITHVNPGQSVDKLPRVVFHPDDITEEQASAYEAALVQQEAANDKMRLIAEHVWGSASNEQPESHTEENNA